MASSGVTSTKQVVIDLKLLSGDATKNIQDLNVKIGNLKAVLKGMKDQGLENSETYIKLSSVLKEMQSTVRQNEKVLVANINQQKAEGDSINALRAKLKAMRAEYEDLGKTARESSFGKNLLKDIDNLTTELKQLEFAQQDFSRQVGEYDVITKPARQAMREMRMECQNLAVALTATEGKIQAQQLIVQSLANTVGTNTQEYAEAVEELNRLNKAYEDTDQHLKQLEQETGKLADTLADSNKRIASFANDEQKIAAMQEGVNVLTSAFTLLQGSLKALGIESKSLLEVYAKIQIVQQSLNSLMTIYKALNKDSNLMIMARIKWEQLRLTWTNAYNAALAKQNGEIAANTVAETANTTAVVANTAAEAAATPVTFSLAAAWAALNAVIKANPIVAIASAIILGITGIVAIVKKLSKANKEAAEEEKKNAEQIKKNSDLYAQSVKERVRMVETVTKKYDEQIAKVKTYLAVLRNEASAYDTKKKALKELITLIPEYNGKLSTTGKFIEGNIAAIENYIKTLKKKAQAEAYTEMLVQSYLKQGTAEREKIQMESNKRWYEKRLESHKQMLEASQSVNDYQTVVEAQKNVDWYTKKLEETELALQKVDAEIKETNKDIATTEKLVSDIGPIETTTTRTTNTSSKSSKEDDEKKAVEDAQKMYAELQKAARDYYNNINRLHADALQKRINEENDRYMKEFDTLASAYTNAIDLSLKGDDFLIKAGIDPEALQRYIGELSNAMDEATRRNKANVQQIKKDWEDALKAVGLEADNAFAKLTAKLEYEINKESETGIKLLRLELDRELALLDEQMQAELAAKQYTEEQKTEITALYAKKREQLVAKEAKAEKKFWIDQTKTTLSAMSEVTGAFSDLFSTLAGNDEKYQKYANALALVDIMTNMAVGIAEAVSAGASMPFPYNLAAIAAGVAAVVSGIASAIALFKKNDKVGSAPRFAKGGLVGNKTTRRKDDTVDAKLSLGEYVIPAPVVDDLGVDFFDGIVDANKHKKESTQGKTVVSKQTTSTESNVETTKSVESAKATDSKASNVETSKATESVLNKTNVETTNNKTVEALKSLESVKSTDLRATNVETNKATDSKASNVETSKATESVLNKTNVETTNNKTVEALKSLESVKSTNLRASNVETIKSTENTSNTSKAKESNVETSKSGTIVERAISNESNVETTKNISNVSIDATANIKNIAASATSTKTETDFEAHKTETSVEDKSAEKVSKTSVYERNIDKIKEFRKTGLVGKIVEYFNGKKRNYSSGGLVGNKTTKRKDDTVDAKLSLGEYVIPSEIVSVFGTEFFDQIIGKKDKKLPKIGNFEIQHFASGGLVKMPNINTNNLTAIDYSEMGAVMQEAVANALGEMPAPEVSVREITNKQNRVLVKERISKQ